MGRPFSAKLRLTDVNDVEFDFGPRADDDDGQAPDFSGQAPLGPCPKCGSRVFETPNAYVCERAVGEGRTCDFRSGRTILQRPIERAQMTRLLESGKTDLLQFVSARTRRPFAAYLVKQADGKVGFEFEAREPGRKGARGARAAPLRVLGAHPRDRQPVELHSGRYGPYVKHGSTNATLPDRDAVESLSLDEAVALVDEKAGRAATGSTRRTVRTRAPRTPTAPATERPVGTATRRRANGNGAASKSARGAAAKSAAKRSATGSAARKRTVKTTATAAHAKTAKKSVAAKRRAPAVPKAVAHTAPRTAKRAGARTRK
jgi:DNA topoisomerase-3